MDVGFMVDMKLLELSRVIVNNAFIRKSTTNYTLDSVKGSPYTLSSDGRTDGRVCRYCQLNEVITA
jgi:hypothetical protein